MTFAKASDLICDPHVPSWNYVKISRVSSSPMQRHRILLSIQSSPMTTNLAECFRILVAASLPSGNVPSVKYFQYGNLHPVVMLK